MRIIMTPLGILAVTLLTATTLHARTPNLPAQIDEIRALLEPDAADSPQARSLKAELRRLPDSWQQMVENDQLGEFQRFHANLDLAALPDVAAKINDLFADVKAERDRREAAKIAKAEALLDHVGDTLKAATKPEELDPLIAALSKSKISDYDNNRKLGALTRDLQNALQTVTSWQDYLVAKESGNTSEMRGNLEHITQQLASSPLVERSFVLRLLKAQPPKTTDSGDSSASKRLPLDEIRRQLAETGGSAAALAALAAMPQAQFNRYSEDESFLRTVQAIEDLRKLEPTMAEAEVFANIRNLTNTHGASHASFALALDQIRLNTIARSYGIETPNAKTTSAWKLLDGIATTASKELDLPKLRKTINLLNNLGNSSYGMDSQARLTDLKIISLIELGAAATQHHDLEAAATAYLEASSLDGEYLQRTVAYGKLVALKEQSPDKVGPILTQAAENRIRLETVRIAAEREAQERMMTERRFYDPLMKRQDPAMHAVVEEVVAEFLKTKRQDPGNKLPDEAKPNKSPAGQAE